jgi:hypothetical protein
MKKAANEAAFSSRRGRLNVRCEERRARRRAGFVHLQFKIRRFVQESCGNLGVLCCFGQPKHDRRLTHEVLFSDHHLYFPLVSQRRRNDSGIGDLFQTRKSKSEFKGGVFPWGHTKPGHWPIQSSH